MSLHRASVLFYMKAVKSPCGSLSRRGFFIKQDGDLEFPGEDCGDYNDSQTQ